MLRSFCRRDRLAVCELVHNRTNLSRRHVGCWPGIATPRGRGRYPGIAEVEPRPSIEEHDARDPERSSTALEPPVSARLMRDVVRGPNAAPAMGPANATWGK